VHAQAGGCSQCPWVTAGDRGFLPILARTRVPGRSDRRPPGHTLPHHESRGAFRLRHPCLRRWAAVVPRMGVFRHRSGRHGNHLQAVGLVTPGNEDYQ